MTENNQKKLDRRVLLGQIASVHGVRGDVVVRSYTAEPGSIAAYGALSDKAGNRTFTLRVVRVTDKGVVAHIRGVDDRTAAELLRGTELYVSRDKLPAATEDEFYHADLIGLAALTVDGAPFGTITAVQNFGAGDLLEIRIEKPADQSRDSAFIPFTKASVPTIDFASGTVTIIEPEMVGEPEPAARETESESETQSDGG